MYEKKEGTFVAHEFPAVVWLKLQNAILAAKKEHLAKTPNAPLVAAFDADGTLWDCDMGENFFDYQVRHCNLATLPANPWEHYEAWKATHPKDAYLWLAQINKGHSYQQVQQWAKAAVEKRVGGLPVFKSQKLLIDFLKQNQYEIYVVTASVRWAVVPAAALLGIDDQHVLGVQTLIENGIVTDVQDGPLTWREGKSEAILKVTDGVRPILASGNTTGDYSLLDTASTVRLAVSSRSNSGDLEKSESALQELAQAQNWFFHQF